MPRGTRPWTLALLLATGAIAGGCTSSEVVKFTAPTRSALFGAADDGSLATQIGRDAWPVTTGRYQSVNDEVYVEYYRDYQGNASNEQNTPVRNFQSYRIGASQR